MIDREKNVISNCEAGERLCFRYTYTNVVQFLYFLNPIFSVSNHHQCMYSSVCVEPVGKQHCLFSRDTAHL